MSVLAELVYPFHSRSGQQLYETLVQLHPSGPAAVLFARLAGVDTSMILEQQPVALLWKDILEAAARAGRTRALVEQVHDRLHVDSPARPFLADLLADRPTPTSGEPRDTDAAPRFVRSGDAVTEPEALLFADDLTVPIGRVPGLITTLQGLVELAPAVCKLTVDVHGTEQYGTGFRIGPDLLLTNWHVVHRRADREQATAVSAEFGFDDDGRGGVLPATAVACDVASIVGDEADDWAVVRAALDDSWPVVDLASTAVPTLAASAYVVQHPRGARKRVGILRNQVSFVDDRVVHYLTDTEVGSSGSPVFDGSGRLIALHHAGGRPQEVLGRPPLRKNEGIRISCVVDGLRGRGLLNMS